MSSVEGKGDGSKEDADATLQKVTGTVDGDTVSQPSAEVADAKLHHIGSTEAETDNVTSRRSHKSTEKGLSFKLQTFHKTLKTHTKRLQRQIDLITQCISSQDQPPNVDILNNEVLSLEKMYSEICATYARAATVMTDDKMDEESEEYIAFTISMEEAESKYFAVKSDACKWQLKQEAILHERDDNRSLAGSETSVKSKNSSRNSSKHSSRNGSRHSSRSSHSSGSQHSSASRHSKQSVRSERSNASNLSLKQRAKVEGLKAEAVAIIKTNEAELQAKLLRVKQRIAKEEAIEKVYREELVLDEGAEKSHRATADDHQKRTRDKRNPRSSKSKKESNDFPNMEVQLAMMDMMKLQCAPPPDIDTFSGDPLEFYYFRTTFKEVIETTVPDQRGCLTRLIKFTSGDAKELIRHCVHADPESCYDQAISLLDKEYGNTHLVSSSYIKELRNWETIKQHDSSGYKKFYRFLLKCQAYKAQGRLSELDSTDVIRTMISKVPTPHQEKWNRKASEIRRRNDREADFSDFIVFFENETALLSDPAYSRDALLEVKSKSYNTRISPKEEATSVCHLCSGPHDIEVCDAFKAKDVDERHRAIFRLKLCFSCLEPVSSDHIAKTCDKKRKCSICDSDHPTSLHGDKVNANLSSLGNHVISMCVVPVLLHHRANPSKQLTVYALLDDCSQGTFIHENTLDDLGVSQLQDAIIRVNTLNGERQEKASSLDGLIVQPISTHVAHYGNIAIELPRTYSQPNLAVDSEEIPTPSKIRPWAYLQPLQDKLMDYDPSVPIGLMIGGNCPKAVESLEVIRSEGGGPYAKRSQLGWCVVGPISKSSATEEMYCNMTRLRIPVKDVASNEVANHCFTSKSTVQDV